MNKGKSLGLLGPRSTEEVPPEMEPRPLRKACQRARAGISKEGQWDWFWGCEKKMKTRVSCHIEIYHCRGKSGDAGRIWRRTARSTSPFPPPAFRSPSSTPYWQNLNSTQLAKETGLQSRSASNTKQVYKVGVNLRPSSIIVEAEGRRNVNL